MRVDGAERFAPGPDAEVDIPAATAAPKNANNTPATAIQTNLRREPMRRMKSDGLVG